MKSNRINFWKSFENCETIVWTVHFSGENSSHKIMETNIAQLKIDSWAIFVSIIVWLCFPGKHIVQTIVS